MVRRPTIHDVAREAGVSTSTVDRVLNGRETVRVETAQRVHDAARRIGYHATRLIEQRLRAELPAVRLGFVLQKERHAFYQNMAETLIETVRMAPGIRGEAAVAFCSTQSHDEIAEKMRDVGRRVDVLAAVAVDHQKVAATVSDLKASGVATFSLLSDFAQGERANYVGLNNLKVGRIAAYMLATAVHGPGEMAVFVGGHRWHGHELRETGFRSYLREFRPDFQVLDTLVNLETRQLTYEATLDLLERHPTLRGMYVAGGGMEGAIEALREARRPGEVALVVNELTPQSRAALSERYVVMAIGTPLDELGRELVSLMIDAAGGSSDGLPGQRFLEPQIYLPESL